MCGCDDAEFDIAGRGGREPGAARAQRAPPCCATTRPTIIGDVCRISGLPPSVLHRCLRQHLVTNYLPAQCCYNLGEYPAMRPWDPDEVDEQELDRLKAIGIQVLQVFDDWNDSLRLFGGDKYSPVNPAGYRRFLEMAHRRGMKVLTYVSPCFLQRTDPDFRPEWSREGDFLVVGYWNIAHCSPASPGWRAFVLPKIAQILDQYGADGLYLDGGYLMNRHAAKRAMRLAPDEVPAFEETPAHDGAFADLLALIYAEVHRRGGIVKLHVDGLDRPLTDLHTYDYLWVGEGVRQADVLRETVKSYAPYVVPCLDMGFTRLESIDEPYLHSIPYLQFPVAMGGRIFTGQRGHIPGVAYQDDFWLQRCRDAWAQYQKNPAKLHTYSAWDEVPGSPQTRTNTRSGCSGTCRWWKKAPGPGWKSATRRCSLRRCPRTSWPRCSPTATCISSWPISSVPRCRLPRPTSTVPSWNLLRLPRENGRCQPGRCRY